MFGSVRNQAGPTASPASGDSLGMVEVGVVDGVGAGVSAGGVDDSVPWIGKVEDGVVGEKDVGSGLAVGVDGEDTAGSNGVGSTAGVAGEGAVGNGSSVIGGGEAGSGPAGVLLGVSVLGSCLVGSVGVSAIKFYPKNIGQPPNL